MAQISNPSTQGLYWVKQELGTSLQRVRDFVEAYLEAPSNSLPLQRALVELHQIRGTLRMVQCEGAALLAEEMKAAVRDLLSALDSAPEKAFETLLGSTLQLSDYLDLVVNGESDNALIFLPIINELRVSRGAGVASESALFVTYAGMHDRTPPEPDLSERTANGGQAVAKQHLMGFQMALLRVLKDQETEAALQRLAVIAQDMTAATTNARGLQLFGAVDALVSALLDGSVTIELEIKRLLGRVGQHIKNAAEGGDNVLQDVPDALLYGLVYFAGRVPSNNPKVVALRNDYGLDDLLPEREKLDKLRARLHSPNMGLINKLSLEIQDDIDKVKDSIDLVIRAGDKAAVSLEETAEIANGIADTLGMLGLDMLKRIVANQAQAITTLAQTGERDPDAWMDVALALLRVEQSLNSALFQHLQNSEAEVDDAEIQPHKDFDAGTAAIHREALVNISRIKTLIPDYLEQPEPGLLRDAVRLLREVEAGFQILDQADGVYVISRLRNFINSSAMSQARTSKATVLLLADAIASVEYYLEEMGAANPGSVNGLQQAKGFVDELALPQDEAQVEQSDESLEPEFAPSAQDSAPMSANAEPAGAIDPEIREIFVEEAQEVLAQLQQDVPAWANNLEDESGRLAEIRRAFHTLKGSGRMVGAAHLGDFGLALEFLLNRCLEQAVVTNSQVANVVKKAVETLPTLIEDFQNNSDALAANEVIARADALSGRVNVEAAPGKTQAQGDTELYRIFHADALAHVRTLRQYSEQASPCLVSPELVRALHTLKGSAQAVHAPDIAHLASELEKFADSSRAAQQPIEAEAMALLGEAANVFEARVDELQLEPGGPQTDTESLLQRALQLNARLPSAAVKESANRKLIIIFTDEGCDLLDEIDRCLQDWRATPNDTHHPHQIKALCHKLKGSATTSKAAVFASIVEALEDRIEAYLRNSSNPESPEFEAMAEVIDGLYDMLDRFRHGDRTGDGQALLALLGQTEPQPHHEVQADLAPQDEPGPEDSVAIDMDLAEFDVSDVDLSGDELEDVTYREVDPELVDIFIEEAEELLEGIRSEVEAWSKQPDDEQPRLALMRQLHTLKGSARMAGVNTIGDLSHELETLVAGAHSAARRGDAELQRNLIEQTDQLTSELDRARSAHVLAQTPEVVAPAEVAEADSPANDISIPERVEQISRPLEFEPRLFWQGEVQQPDIRVQEDTARVAVDQLETMLNEAGEISIYRARLEQQNTGLRFQLRELAQTTGRLREQLRTLDMETETQIMARHEPSADRYDEEFDPLEMDRYSALHELSRSLAESVTDLGSLHGFISELVEQGETLVSQQGRVNTSLQQGLMRTLMVPFSLQVQRLQRILRQISDEYGRRARLEFSGAEAELDRNVLERMAAPLEHLLRNAIIHGLETPEERRAAAKSEVGRIAVNLHREGTQLVIDVRDDGRGLDLAAIRGTAVSKGLLRDDARIDDTDLAAFIFEPGFSTALELTQAAGRGVGLDVVNAQIKQLGGSMAVDTLAGKGTSFTIRLPLTLAITHALMARVGEETYAVPIGSVEGVTRLSSDELAGHLSRETASFAYGGFNYRVLSLGETLGGAALSKDDDAKPRSLPLLLARAGERRTAFVVDGMLGSREIVVKSVGPQVSTVPGISGATLQADGTVVLILDVAALMQLQVRQALGTEMITQAAEITDDRPLIMVVDDSITIRRVSERLLTRSGMRVVTAKDGMDALAKLQSNTPDAVLLDIEMPRIDGFELATYMRNSESLKHTPIIMVTSRSGDKHRRRAEQIGVNKFMTKPYQDQELLQQLYAVMHKKPPAAH